MKTVVIIQSNYLPWKGYFDLIHDADLFIFHDCVQFTKQDWRTRNRIKMRDGLHWISVPVHAAKDARICDVTLAGDDWAGKHLRTLHHAYGKAPHWRELESYLAELYGRTWASLSELNQTLIGRIARDWLGIDTELVDSRQFQAVGAKTERVIDLLVKAGATRYISGPAARAYLEPARFAEADIELVYKDYSGYPEYPQPHPPFDHAVTILDVLACVGRDASKFIWGWRSMV
jgi:hypothetical protein